MLTEAIEAALLRTGLGDCDEEGSWVYTDKAAEWLVEEILLSWAELNRKRSGPITPIGDQVTVRAAIRSETTDSGALFIPETAREMSTEGVVLAVGPKATDLEPGDRVFFRKRAGTVFRVGEEDVRVLSQDDLVARLEVVPPSS